MSRAFILMMLLAAWVSLSLHAAEGDDGPPISITSPDAGTTFAYGEVKRHSLTWQKEQKMLIAHVAFTDQQLNEGQPQEDYHEFRLPGITFDEVKGIFYATTAKGQLIPVAHIKKRLFIKSIEVLPNAAVRIEHPRGVITVTLEAIFPNDPAMSPAPSDPDGTHKVDINKIFN